MRASDILYSGGRIEHALSVAAVDLELRGALESKLWYEADNTYKLWSLQRCLIMWYTAQLLRCLIPDLVCVLLTYWVLNLNAWAHLVSRLPVRVHVSSS